jgi:hypothetical protein
MADRDDIMSRHSRVEPLQLGHPKPGLGDRAGWHLSQQLIVIGVELLEHRDRAGRPDKEDPAGGLVIVDIRRRGYPSAAP